MSLKVISKKKKFPLKPFVSRKFINENEPGSNAMIVTKVFKHNSFGDDYSITFTDCSNRVRLHGDLRTIKERKLAISRIDNLVSELERLKDNMIAQFKTNNVRY